MGGDVIDFGLEDALRLGEMCEALGHICKRRRVIDSMKCTVCLRELDVINGGYAE